MNDPQTTTATQTLPPTIEQTLREENSRMFSEIRAKQERIDDLAGQIKILQSSRLIAPHEEEAIAEKSRAFDAMNDEQNRIAKFLRDNFAAEITSGLHNGRPLSAIINGYLGELKALRTAKDKPGFIERVFGA